MKKSKSTKEQDENPSHEHDHHQDHDYNHDHDEQGHDHENSCNNEVSGCSCCDSGLLESLDDEHHDNHHENFLTKMGIGWILLALAVSLEHFIPQPTLSFGFIHIENIISISIFLIIVIFVGLNIITNGIKASSKGNLQIEFLMTIATVGAFLIGEGLEGASLVLLFSLAEYIEEFTLTKSKKSLHELVNLNPDMATVRDDKTFEVKVEDLNIGDVVIVKPGDKIPIDGVILTGSTSVNQASITGESLAVSKNIGDEVYGSTINEDGYIEIEVTKTFKNTIFSKIVDLIKESGEKKAKIDIFINKFARYYTPAIVLIAILVTVLPSIFFHQPLIEWFKRSLVLLVISCPCALVISTPVSIVSAITSGTKNGIIIKGGEYVEELSRIKAILFDKTGTLTEGKLNIADIVSNGEYSEDEIIKLVYSIESKSKHPIAKAIQKYGETKNIKALKVDYFQSIAGKGLKADINGTSYYLGKKELFDYNKNFKDVINNLSNENQRKTTVILGNETEIIGLISLNDKIRDNGKETIYDIKNSDIKTIMLTGDNDSAAKSVADYLTLDKYYSNLLPQDKLSILENLSQKYHDIAMVGDGVNDAPSLARANVGIAMGMDGADIAIETADIVLMQDNISKISFLLKLAKKTMSIVKQNVGISIAMKAILIVLGILGYVTLLEAVIIGDMGVTLIVVGNALRIR
ncbi:MAG: cadmium-translocating P-type ATPase [Methanobrevibacter sp.]|jgi:Cd2+/Zn2+-exporting ATPase|nr:cadmium-translocating P-type ATPase [Candidatus Methanovirga australis]